MKKIIFATQNRHKFEEIRKALVGAPVEISPAFQFPGIPEVLEDGNTLEENALKKARVVSGVTGIPAMADDTGLFVEALGGQPGIYAARFAGEGCSYEDNVRKLLKLLEGVPEKFRKAIFRTVVSVVFPGEDPVFLDGEVTGTITEVRRGIHGFGYDPVFQPEGSSKVFAEMTLGEKNKLSHRGKALQKVERLLDRKFRAHSL